MDIKRCILQHASKTKINKDNQSFTAELVLESLVMKFFELKKNKAAF